ncbi:MAG: DUF4340 domain-containing protein [Calditrichaeota bacterium]|nr:DUF4340 domain-containing protein [Calditrichota bacterium]MBT7787307.1 DUF4340 domain-containing protein [Calditrichota bacterium]
MKRPITMLSIILVIQIIIMLLVSTDTNKVTKKEAFLKSDTSRVDYIKIQNEHGELVMKRFGMTWKITEPIEWKANSSYIKTLLEKMAELKLESAITSNEDKYVLYELDGAVAKYIEIGEEGGVIDKFYCGKPSENYKHTYVRQADSDEVWMVSGSPRSSFTREPSMWRDKGILALDKTMIEQIKLKFPNEVITLNRVIDTGGDSDSGFVMPDTSWMATKRNGESFEPVEKATNRILNTLKRLNAMKFMDAPTDTIPDFSNPEFTIEVYLEGDQKEVLDFIPKADEETRYVARHNGEESTVFVIYQSTVKNLKKDEDALKGIEKKEEPEF